MSDQIAEDKSDQLTLARAFWVNVLIALNVCVMILRILKTSSQSTISVNKVRDRGKKI